MLRSTLRYSYVFAVARGEVSVEEEPPVLVTHKPTVHCVHPVTYVMLQSTDERTRVSDLYGYTESRLIARLEISSMLSPRCHRRDVVSRSGRGSEGALPELIIAPAHWTVVAVIGL